jgi:hypothetical protein
LPRGQANNVYTKEGVRMESRIIAAVAGLIGGIETLSILMLLCRV